MRHTILTVLLTLGVVGGLAAGIHSVSRHHWRNQRHFEEHIADICVRAALDAQQSPTPQQRSDSR